MSEELWKEIITKALSDPGLEYVNEIMKIEMFLDPIAERMVRSIESKQSLDITREELASIDKALKDILVALENIKKHVATAKDRSLIPFYSECCIEATRFAQHWSNIVMLAASYSSFFPTN